MIRHWQISTQSKETLLYRHQQVGNGKAKVCTDGVAKEPYGDACSDNDDAPHPAQGDIAVGEPQYEQWREQAYQNDSQLHNVGITFLRPDYQADCPSSPHH